MDRLDKKVAVIAMAIDGGLTAGGSIFGQQAANQAPTILGGFAGPSFETKI